RVARVRERQERDLLGLQVLDEALDPLLVPLERGGLGLCQELAKQTIVEGAAGLRIDPPGTGQDISRSRGSDPRSLEQPEELNCGLEVSHRTGSCYRRCGRSSHRPARTLPVHRPPGAPWPRSSSRSPTGTDRPPGARCVPSTGRSRSLWYPE